MAYTARTFCLVNYTHSLIKKSIPFPISSIKFRYLHTSDSRNHYKTKKWFAPTLMKMKTRVDELKEKGLYPISIRSQFLEWNYDSEIFSFCKRLNEEFDIKLLHEALTDDSYIFQESQNLEEAGMDDKRLSLKSNDDLASAGKGLIEDFSIKFLRAACPLLPEEVIGSFADYLTSDEILCRIAQQLGFNDLILTKEYPPSEATFAKSFAAVVSCLNVSSGLERCHLFIRDFVVTQLVGKDLFDIWEIEDPFQIVNNILVRNGRGPADPRLLGELGKNTIESVFYVGIYDGNKKLYGKGYGETAGISVKVAAYDALGKMFNQTSAKAPLPFISQDINQYMKTEPNVSLDEWTFP